MYLTKLSEIFDIDKLRNEVNELLDTYSLVENQLALNYREGFLNDCWADGCGSPYQSSGNDTPIENRENLSAKPRFIDTDFKYINPALKNTEIEKIYNCFKKIYTIGRYRIAVLNPKTCYGWHYDLEKRIHVPIITNPGAFIITDDGKATHLPATGESWMFNANNGYHTAVNSSYKESRIHLLLNIWND